MQKLSTTLLLRSLCLLLCLLLTGIVQAGAATPASSAVVILDDAVTTLDIARQLEVFKAEKQGLSVQQLSSPQYSYQFIPNKTAVTNYGYSDNDVWIRFNLQSQSSAIWYLMLDHLTLGEAEIFISPHDDVSGTITDSLTLLAPVMNHRTPVWKANFPEGMLFSVYLRLYNPKETLVLSVTLMQEGDFIAYSNSRYVFFSIILMGIMTLAIYNLFLAFSLQDKGYVILFGFILFMGWVIYRVGNIYPSLHGGLVSPKNSYYTSIGSLAMFAAAYYWYILHQGTEKWLEILLKCMAYISISIAIVANIYPFNTSIPYTVLLPVLLALPVLTIRAIIIGNKNIITNLFPMLLLMVSIGIYIPLFMGRFPDYPLISYDIGFIGVLFAVLLLSLNHADRTRQLRAQAERAETNSKATHNFLTSMSHELRTPMHTVLGANQLLKATGPSQEQQGYINSSDLASRQMLRLVDDILDTARLHSDQPILIEESPFELHKTLASFEELFGIQVNQKKLSFIVRAKGVPLTKVIGDERCLNQVLVNLIGNAIKYTESGSVILKVSVGAGSNNSDEKRIPIRFAVQDTGPGIPLEQHSLLFQPFFQVDSGHARRKDGAGLGLAISHKLVQQMGGELQVESMPGQGSCFFFTLNLAVGNEQSPITHESMVQRPRQTAISHNSRPAISTEPTQPTQTQTGPTIKPLSGLKILLVDDGELNLMIGGQLLTIQGAEVSLAQSGHEALRSLTEEAFDLALMDVSMPEMDGYETTRLLRENPDLKTLPVIALTAHAIAGERARCLNAGMNDYLSKPFQTEQLLKLIRQHCP